MVFCDKNEKDYSLFIVLLCLYKKQKQIIVQLYSVYWCIVWLQILASPNVQ